MTPKTQSVCKHCGKAKNSFCHLPIKGQSQFNHHEFEPVAEPASTGEPPQKTGGWPCQSCGYGHEIETDCPKKQRAARPSEPSAPLYSEQELKEQGLQATTTNYGKEGSATMYSPAPQTSAEPHSKLCYYKPHTIECRRLGDFKLVDSDTGKEFYVCSQHIQGYRDYNERCGRVIFVIVLYKRAPQPVSAPNNVDEAFAGMASDEAYQKETRKLAGETWDAPKVEEIAKKAAAEIFAKVFRFDPLRSEQIEKIILRYLRPYFPPVSQTLINPKEFARKYRERAKEHERESSKEARNGSIAMSQLYVGFCSAYSVVADEWEAIAAATPASTARTEDHKVSNEDFDKWQTDNGNMTADRDTYQMIRSIAVDFTNSLAAPGSVPQAPKRPNIICLCGSTRFIEQFAIKTWELELKGNIVLGCTLLPSWYCPVRDHFAESLGVKEQRDNHHLQKIDLADEVLVLNIGGYIGESTRREIEYAAKIGKPINYLEPIAAGAAQPGDDRPGGAE